MAPRASVWAAPAEIPDIPDTPENPGSHTHAGAERWFPGRGVHAQTNVREEAPEGGNHPQPEQKDGSQVTVRGLGSVFQWLQISSVSASAPNCVAGRVALLAFRREVNVNVRLTPSKSPS